MKILEVYDKNGREKLKCCGKRVFPLMDQFFSECPLEYGENYYKNLVDLKLFMVDEFEDQSFEGGYNEKNNLLIFKTRKSLCHELMHVASYDRERDASSFEMKQSWFEMGLDEGMTELLAMRVLGLSEPISYPFEVFCADMISNIDGIFKPYFTVNHEEFIKLFKEPRDIYSLMYSLNYYSEHNMDKNIGDTDIELAIRRSIRNTIDSLISIELGYEKNPRKLKLYKEKFMDILTSDLVRNQVGYYYKNYDGYADEQIRKRIRVQR